MKTPIADIKTSIEYFNKSNWEYLYSKNKKDRTIDLWAHHNPFSGYRMIAAWGFSNSKKELVFFEHPQIIPIELGSDEFDERQYAFFLSCSRIIEKFQDHSINFETFLQALKSDTSQIAEKYNLEVDYLEKNKNYLKVRKVPFKQATFFGLYDIRRRISDDSQENDETRNILIDFYDYYRINSNLSDSIPRQYILNNFDDDEVGQMAIFQNVRRFNPLNNNDVKFKWPWQRCISASECDGKIKIKYKSIPTTSLVLDLRNSTVAMNLTDNPEEYAEFIDKIIIITKSIISEYGGFFDKETGDGLVAHFSDFAAFEHYKDNQTSTMRAYKCAQDIIQKTRQICRDYQPSLALKMGGLGGAIGIHKGNAVWLADRDQIRAIGDSVVFASRLCSNCPVNGIVLSNTSFEEIQSKLNGHEKARVEEIPLKFKEHSESAQLLGHLVRYDCAK